jgi:deoxyribonuclease V
MYKAALDVYYFNHSAKAVCLLFERWEDRTPSHIYTQIIEGVEDYEPGAFYKRELPCLLQVLKAVDLSSLEVIIIDGYVYLDDEGRHGLGIWLYKALNETCPVLGVAKTAFHNNTKNVVTMTRGSSRKPLYITAVGMDAAYAAGCIRQMAGPYRIPVLLKELDKRTREKGL